MLAEESTANDALGHDVAFKVAQKVRPGDSTKFRSYVDDVGYITMLLLSLSGRLARTENALHTFSEKTVADKVRKQTPLVLKACVHIKISFETENLGDKT